VAAFEAKAARMRLLLAVSAISIVLKRKLKSLKQRIARRRRKGAAAKAARRIDHFLAAFTSPPSCHLGLATL
jgi:hypothetical protein